MDGSLCRRKISNEDFSDYVRDVNKEKSGALHMPIKRSAAAVGIHAMSTVSFAVVEAAR